MRQIVVVLVVCASIALCQAQGTLDELIDEIFKPDNSGANNPNPAPTQPSNPNPSYNGNGNGNGHTPELSSIPTPVIVEGGHHPAGPNVSDAQIWVYFHLN